MAVNDVWRLSMIGSHTGSEIAVITMHVRMKSANGEPEGACNILATNLLDNLKTKQATTFRWDRIVCLSRNLAPPQSVEYTTGFPKAGTVGLEELPHQVGVVVTSKTAYAGRSYRGRHYLPAFTESEMTAGILETATYTAVQGYYDALVGLIGSAGSNSDYTWVVWSDKLNIATPVTQAIVRTVPGVVRRRRVGVGQ